MRPADRGGEAGTGRGCGMTYYLTTCLQFADGSREGQFLHVGDQESCDEVNACLPAIMYSGDRQVAASAMLTIPEFEFGDELPQVGQCWRQK